MPGEENTARRLGVDENKQPTMISMKRRDVVDGNLDGSVTIVSPHRGKVNPNLASIRAFTIARGANREEAANFAGTL